MTVTTPAPAPSPAAARVRYLDVLRGFALLGILPVNMPFFALPVTAASEAAWVTGGALRERLAFHGTRFFFELKFITLFSFLFGVGMMVMRLRADAMGRRYAPLMLRRLGALLVFGIAHAVLVWYGDILAYYAVIGLLTFWAASLSARALFRGGVVLIALPAAGLVVLTAGVFLLQQNAQLAPVLEAFMEPGGEDFVPGSTLGSWPEFFRAMEHFGPGLEQEVYGSGSFARITFVRTMTWLFGALMQGVYLVWRIAGLMLIGMAWTRAGWFLDPAGHRVRFRRLVLWGLGAGLPLQGAATALDVLAGSPAAAVCSHLLLYLGSLGISAAYAGLVGLFAAGASWARPLEAIGRTAFSNYILQSLLSTAIFYSYGLALFGTVDRATLWLVVLGIWALQLAVTPLWTQRFRFGPLEWLWRRMTYGSLS